MKNSITDDADEMRPEYDFTDAVQGKYAGRYAEGTNIVILAPEVAAVFPNSAAVNAALKTLIAAARESVPSP